jgi:general L-amino acid transport system permease protein
MEARHRMTAATIVQTGRPSHRAPRLRGRVNLVVTLLLGALLAYVVAQLTRWAVLDAVWTLPRGADSSICRAAAGACWAVIGERFRFILFGTYPFAEQWRPAVVCGLFVALYAVSAVPAWWTRWLAAGWVAAPACAIVLLRGGSLGLPSVPTALWGGLPLTFLLSTIGFGIAGPLAIALALGRRSRMPAIRALCVAYIELIRGVPLVSLLFMAAVMFPLFVPQGITIDALVRAQAAVVMVIAAYLAEVVRGGLQAVPAGQYEAATSIGLGYWPATSLVILPQALRIAIPSIVNTFIAFFKDTSLVVVIGLFDLLGAAKAVLVDPKWVGFGVEVYCFVAMVYFVFCAAVSAYTRRLERMLAARHDR